MRSNGSIDFPRVLSLGETPLDYAIIKNTSVEVLKYLISLGADINPEGHTPLCSAAEYNSNVEVLECLVSNGAVVNAKDELGCTPLHKAVHNPNVDVFHYLVSHGADVNAKDKYGRTSFDHADTEEKRNTLRDAMEVSKSIAKSTKQMGLRLNLTK